MSPKYGIIPRAQSWKGRQIPLDFHHGGAESHSHAPHLICILDTDWPFLLVLPSMDSRMPYLPSYPLHSIVYDRETSHHNKEVQRWGLPHGIDWFYHIPPPPGSDWPKQKENGLPRSHYGTSWETASCKNWVLSYRCSVFFGSERCSCFCSRNTSSSSGSGFSHCYIW